VAEASLPVTIYTCEHEQVIQLLSRCSSWLSPKLVQERAVSEQGVAVRGECGYSLGHISLSVLHGGSFIFTDNTCTGQM
jgi:hypothetical protein